MLVLLAVSIYLHVIYWRRHRSRVAAVQVNFLRRIAARDSDAIVGFWAFGTSLAVVVLFFLPYSEHDPRSDYTIVRDFISHRAVTPLPKSEPKPPDRIRFWGWWIIPFSLGTYLSLLWSYRRHFKWAGLQFQGVRSTLRLSETSILAIAFAFVAASFVLLIALQQPPPN